MTSRSVSTIIALFAVALAIYEIAATINGSYQNHYDGTISVHALWVIGAYGALAALTAFGDAALET